MMPRRFTLLLIRIILRLVELSRPRYRDLMRGMAAELNSIADPVEQARFALGAIAAGVRLVLRGYGRPAATAVTTGATMRFPLKTHRRFDKSYFQMVAIALLPVVAVSILIQVLGGMRGGSESVIDRVSQVASFPTFWVACHYVRARQTLTTS